MRFVRKLTLRDFAITMLLFFMGIFCSFGLTYAGLRSESVFVLFILGMTICILETETVVWGAFLGVSYPLFFDLLFIAPQFSLMSPDPNFFISCAIFIVVAFILGSLADKLKEQLRVARTTERMMGALSGISTGLANHSSAKSLYAYISRELTRALGLDVVAHRRVEEDASAAARACFENGVATGRGEDEHPRDPHTYVPIRAHRKQHGYLEIDTSRKKLNSNERNFLVSVSTQMALALERNAQELELSYDKAGEMYDALKASLLDNVSDSLCTPLVRIGEDADSIEDSLDSNEAVSVGDAVDDIRFNVETLSRAIGKLGYLARLENSSHVPERHDVDLEELTSRVAREALKAHGRHIGVRIDAEDNVASLNEHMVLDVLELLIENAVENTSSDVAIDLKVSKSMGMLTFAVEDGGEGVPSEETDTIFHRFATGRKNEDGKPLSMGLGLSLCKAIVEVQNGFIYAENLPGTGFCVTFSLPMDD